ADDDEGRSHQPASRIGQLEQSDQYGDRRPVLQIVIGPQQPEVVRRHQQTESGEEKTDDEFRDLDGDWLIDSLFHARNDTAAFARSPVAAGKWWWEGGEWRLFAHELEFRVADVDQRRDLVVAPVAVAIQGDVGGDVWRGRRQLR